MVTALLFPPVQLLAACQRRRAACRCGAARHPERAAPGDAPPQNGTMSGRRPLQEGRGAIMQPPTLQGLPGGGQKHGSAPGTPLACALRAAAEQSRHPARRVSALPAPARATVPVPSCERAATSAQPGSTWQSLSAPAGGRRQGLLPVVSGHYPGHAVHYAYSR